MSKSNIIVGNIGGEKWVGTNDNGVGKMLFKLSDSEELKRNHDLLVEENKRLRDMLNRLISHDNCKKDVIHLMSEADSLLSELCGE